MSVVEMNSKDAIIELIKCPICLEIFTDPRKKLINLKFS